MSFGMCVRTQFGFGEWCRILTTMALAHPFLLSESGVELPRYRRTVLLTTAKSRKTVLRRGNDFSAVVPPATA
jgi:hypothetical protein